MESIKVFAPIIIMWFALICFVIIDKVGGRFVALEKDVSILKTVLIIQDILPAKLAMRGVENDN